MPRTVFRVPPPSPFVGVTVHPGVVHQRMTGWECHAQIGLLGTGLADVKDEILDLAANTVGVNRLRLPVRSGSESTTGDGTSYVMENDNADPFVLNEAGFVWTFPDGFVTNVVLPMKALLAARGESLYVNLNYVAFVGA